MNSALGILFKCLTREYYKQNAAFFGFIILVAFGLLRGTEHVAIGIFLISDMWMLLLLFLVFAAYFIKTIWFVIKAFEKPENSMLLSHLFTLATRSQVYSLIIISASLLIPVIAYSLFLIVLAIENNHPDSIALIAAFDSALIFTGFFLMRRKIHFLPHEKKISKISIQLNRYFTRKPAFYFVEYLFRKDLLLIILSKAYSILLLLGVILFYKTDTYDVRVLATGVLLAFVGNIALSAKYIWFEHSQLRFIKNLPYNILKRYLHFLRTTFIILLPELLVMARHFISEATVFQTAELFLYGMSIVLLMGSYMLVRVMTLEEVMTKIFWLVVASTILILFKTPILFLATANFSLSFFLFHKSYYTYEYYEEE